MIERGELNSWQLPYFSGSLDLFVTFPRFSTRVEGQLVQLDGQTLGMLLDTIFQKSPEFETPGFETLDIFESFRFYVPTI